MEMADPLGIRLLESAAKWELIVLVTSFGLVSLWRLLKDGSFAGLLRAKDNTLSPGRIQMLMVTVLVALQYLLSTIQDPTHLPDISPNLVAVLGGSQLIYLGGKAWDAFRPNSNT